MLHLETLEDLRALGEDDPVFFPSLLAAFLDSLNSRLPSIESAIQERSGEKLALAAHALKSSCYNLGAQVLGELCQALENLGKLGNTEGADVLWRALLIESIAVQKEISELPEMMK
ncbi:MAG: Hpt domain-containing protein [Bdellovibrionales bacterium]|nr:Hpt domain-containing protein [Oligoflexia bacterium]